MGNWRNRRRFFHRRERSPKTPHYYDNPEPEYYPDYGDVDDGIPAWEKQFCSVIGTLPWGKVVYTKKYMYCHNNILKWDDSAGEEAFQNAKKCFWAKINSLPCDISQPDPDLYIDDVNWNPDIDPELIKDLERDFFCPEEDERDSKVRRRNKRTRNFTSNPSELCEGNPGNWAKNLRECKDDLNNNVTLKDGAQASNQWDSNKILSIESNNDDNPWEQLSPRATEAVNGNAWSNCVGTSWGWNPSGKDVNRWSNWGKETSCERQGRGANYEKNVEWGKFGDHFWGNKEQGLEKSNDDHAWRNNAAPLETMRARGWRNNEGDAWGREKWNNYGKEANKIYSREASSGWGTWKNFQEKAGGRNPYKMENKSTTYSKNAWVNRYDNHRDQCWREVKSKKRVSFAVE